MLAYDNCFVATGGSPRTLTVPGKDLRNVYTIRVPEDAHAILAAVDGADVVVVGSSFIGMETASALFPKAKSVHIIGMEKVPFERVLGPDLGTAMRQLHEIKSEGKIVFHMQRTVKELRGVNGAVSAVVLDGDTVLPAGLVVVGAGVVPTTSMFNVRCNWS